jgi:hypothetical protein
MVRYISGLLKADEAHDHLPEPEASRSRVCYSIASLSSTWPSSRKLINRLFRVP